MDIEPSVPDSADDGGALGILPKNGLEAEDAYRLGKEGEAMASENPIPEFKTDLKTTIAKVSYVTGLPELASLRSECL